jgi:hypothetical protein
MEFLAGNRIRGTSADRVAYGIPVSTTGLKAYYKFNETSGNVINQASAVGSSVMVASSDLVTAGVTYIPSGSGSPFGYAMSYDGTNDAARASSSALADWKFLSEGGTTFTVAGWVYRDGTTEDALTSTGNSGSGETAYLMRLTSGNTTLTPIFGTTGVDRVAYGTTVTMATGGWHFMVHTYDDSTGESIVTIDDGTPEVNGGHNLTNTNSPETYLLFAESLGEANFFAGDTAEFSFWNRVLNATEITDLYNSGSGVSLSTPINAVDGSIFYETDTNKEYVLYNNTWTEV